MTTKDKREPAYSDTDPMPFGKHSGEPLQDVPAKYLQWLWRSGLVDYSRNVAKAYANDQTMLANYIWNSQDAIAQETGELL